MELPQAVFESRILRDRTTCVAGWGGKEHLVFRRGFCPPLIGGSPESKGSEIVNACISSGEWANRAGVERQHQDHECGGRGLVRVIFWVIWDRKPETTLCPGAARGWKERTE